MPQIFAALAPGLRRCQAAAKFIGEVYLSSAAQALLRCARGTLGIFLPRLWKTHGTDLPDREAFARKLLRRCSPPQEETGLGFGATIAAMALAGRATAASVFRTSSASSAVRLIARLQRLGQGRPAFHRPVQGQ